ncbi:DUF3558 domain-containing protein [Saccharopolyspora endophytica]|uniref:DUF3558 domain-containing protein n=1 Tax=Saccharopolyspora endophytica TaxID=543886 RepID=A0ABS5DJS1_9PSEU|nr:DUF3558 domain-containing protein [Saccharopolyspora endophytica]
MRKGLAIGSVLASFVLAGCSGNGGTTETPSSAPAESPAPPSSSRQAPAKSVQLADQCMSLPQDQHQALGITMPPQPRESNGKPGCTYVSGQAGSDQGWNAFVTVTTTETMQGFTETTANVVPAEVAGYPAAQSGNEGRNCMVSVDVSDQGSVFVNAISRVQNVNACDVGKQIAGAVVQNLPNA